MGPSRQKIGLYRELMMHTVIDSIAWSARSMCHWQECKFCDIFLEICSKHGQKHVDIWEFGDIIGRYKRNYLVKIMKEKFRNLKTCRYREMSIYRMSI